MSTLVKQVESQLSRAHNAVGKAIELIETHYADLPVTNHESPEHLREARCWFLGATGRLRGLANELRTEVPFVGNLVIKMIHATDTNLAKEKPNERRAAPTEPRDNDRQSVRTPNANSGNRSRKKGSPRPVR